MACVSLSPQASENIIETLLKLFSYVHIKPMRSGNSFGIKNIFEKMHRENRYIPVHFCIALPYRQGFPFENFWTFSNVSKVSKVIYAQRPLYMRRPYMLYNSKLLCQNTKSHLSQLLSILGRF